jgi:hypothetical protein
VSAYLRIELILEVENVAPKAVYLRVALESECFGHALD